MRNTNNCALPTTLTQPQSQKGNNVNVVPEIPTAKTKAYHKDVTLLGSASIKNIDMSQLVPSAGNQPTAVKDSGQYTMQQLSETVRRTVTSPTLIIHFGSIT